MDRAGQRESERESVDDISFVVHIAYQEQDSILRQRRDGGVGHPRACRFEMVHWDRRTT